MTLTLVSTTTTTSYSTPGPMSLVPNNAQGNLLVAMVAWNVQAPSGQTSGSGVVGSTSAPIVPCSAVADNQGNRWRQVADSGNGVTGARCAIWICANALPVTKWLSACPQGNYASGTLAVFEYSGAPASYWPSIDFALSTNSYSSTSLSLSPLTAIADYCFSIACTGDTGVTLTGPTGAGWSTLTTQTVGGVSPDGTQSTMGWATVTAGTTQTTSYSLSAARMCAMCVVGISQASALPLQQKVDYPLVVTEMAFGSSIGDPSTALVSGTWTDISSYTQGPDGSPIITATRGRQYELDQPESGELAIRVNNQTGAFNPSSTSSPFYSNAINKNMSFQSGVSPWVSHASSGVANVSVSQSSAFSFASAPNAISQYSAQVVVAAVSTTAPGISSELVPVSSNYQYTASGWIYLPTGSASGQAGINWDNSGGSLVGSSLGTAVPLVAGAWTYVTVTGTPTNNTVVFGRILIQLTGTISSGITFYVAEAGVIAGTSAIQTGLVRLGTPVRVTAFWNGRNYPVAYGLVERWPQTWPDFAQWGWSTLIATDIAGAAAVTMPSALQGELLADQPYLCFPFSEQYTASSSTVNGVTKTASECDGQIALNTSLANQRPAVYSDGTVAIATGQTLSFLGDSGTGAGTTNYNAFDTSGNRGPGTQYGPDLFLPSLNSSGTGNISFEVWTVVPTNVTLPTQVTVQLYEILVNPNLSSNGVANLAQGSLITGGLIYATAGVKEYWQPSWNASLFVSGLVSQGSLCQVGGVLTNGALGTLLNGIIGGSIGSAPTSGNLYAVCFGLSTSVTGSRGPFDGNYNYSMAYGTLYNYELSPRRVSQHWLAGSTGFSGDTCIQRAGRYVAWSRVNVGLAGPQVTETPLLGPAYGTGGIQMNAALTSDSVSCGSRWGAIGNGNLVVVPRTSVYNNTSTVSFNDNPVGLLNTNAEFTSGTTGWSAVDNASLAQVSGQGFAPLNLRITPDGVTAGPGAATTGTGTSAIPVTGSTSYVAGTWAMSAAGWSSGATVVITWYTSGGATISTSASAVMQLSTAGAWTYAELSATSPSNAAFAQASFNVAGTPSSSSLFYLARFTLVLANDSIPFEPDMGIDYDNTYVNNSAQATLISGPNNLASPLVVDQASVVKYLQRGPLSQQVSGQTTEDAYDRATWSLNLYQEPSMRISGMTVDLASRPLSFYSGLQTDIGDIALVSRSPAGALPYTLLVTTEQVSISIGPGQWTVAYQQSPYTVPGAVLTASSGSSGVLGNNSLPW